MKVIESNAVSTFLKIHLCMFGYSRRIDLVCKGIFHRHTLAFVYVCVCVRVYAFVCRLLWSCVVIGFLDVIVEIRTSER